MTTCLNSKAFVKMIMRKDLLGKSSSAQEVGKGAILKVSMLSKFKHYTELSRKLHNKHSSIIYILINISTLHITS